MKLPQLLHSTRSYGRANSAFSWKLLVLERGFLSYRLKLPCDRSAKDAWFGYSPVGALRKLPFILYSRPAEDWLQRSGSSSTISPTTLFFAIVARGRRDCSRSSTRRGSREYATTPASMPPRWSRPIREWLHRVVGRPSPNAQRRHLHRELSRVVGPGGISMPEELQACRRSRVAAIRSQCPRARAALAGWSD
jgi:hypothetical protein